MHICMKTCHVFSMVINNIGSLSRPMALIEDVMSVQFYDKVGVYKQTL